MMEPGHELDALIAEKVMVDYECDNCGSNHSCGCAVVEIGSGHQCYSTEIDPAWQVVEKMREMGFYPDLISTGNGYLWRCELHTANDEKYPDNPYCAPADTAPHAICLAALKAVGGLDE